jgi:ferredoxin-NADP reductase
MSTHPAVLTRVIDETPKDRTLVFRVPPEARAAFRAQPGQYVTFHDVLDGKPVARSYSFSSVPTADGEFGITVRNYGAYGMRLYGLRPGARLDVQPPRGGFVLDVQPGQTLVLAGGGSGITPYRAYLKALRDAAHRDPVVVLHSVREPDELIFRAEFEAAARACPWFRYLPTVTRLPSGAAWAGRVGRVDAALLRSLWSDPARAVVYACGPNEFVDAMLGIARDAGLPADHLRREKWG